LLVDALASDRAAVVETALRFIVGCQDEKRREHLRSALRTVFNRGDEPLKFQACLPLTRDFHDTDAWLYVLEQTVSQDANRVRTTLNWIGDTKNCGQSPDARLWKRIGELLTSNVADARRAAVQVLGTFAGDDVVRRMIDLLADSEGTVVRQAEASLTSQPDRTLVRRLLEGAAANHRDGVVRERAAQMLKKLSN
jgi:hypothetical protein